MGTGNFTNQNDGEVANASDLQQLIDALKIDIVPRNLSGVATASSGSIGTESIPFKKAHVASGYFFPGMIIPMHTFNGSVSPGQGWFPCDGTLINEANYEAVHGVGSWLEFVGSSALDGKFSPNMNGRYLAGAATTTQDGSSPISPVGNANSETSLAHTHTGPSHNHKWYDYINDSSASITYQSNGSPQNIAADSKTAGALKTIIVEDGGAGTRDLTGASTTGLYTQNSGTGTTGSALGTADIRPESIEVKYYIRIV